MPLPAVAASTVEPTSQAGVSRRLPSPGVLRTPCSRHRRFDPASHRPLPFPLRGNGVDVRLSGPGSSSRDLWSLLETLPLRSGSGGHPRFAAMTPSLASSLTRSTRNGAWFFESRPVVAPRSLAAQKLLPMPRSLRDRGLVARFFVGKEHQTKNRATARFCSFVRQAWREAT
jgi:hypothetical protein